MAVSSTKTEVEGLSDLLDALGELPKATARNVQMRVLTAAAAPIQATAQSLAPWPKAKLTRAQSGRLRLKSTIAVTTKLSRRQKVVHRQWLGTLPAEDGADPAKDLFVFIGPRPLHEATLEEFGTSRQAPQPYMRPAWDGHKDQALEAIKAGLGAEIEKAVQRLARKAERLAAKINAGK